MLRSIRVLVVITSCFIVTQEEGQARRPGEAGNPFVKQEERPGIFTGAMERRKAARKLARTQAPATEEAHAEKPSTEKRSAQSEESVSKGVSNKKADRTKSASASKKANKVRTVRKGDPGRRGKGGGPSRRRRSVLQPLFGE